MASFDSTNAFASGAFAFDAFFRDFDLSLGKDTLVLTNRVATVQASTDINLNFDALTTTTYPVVLETASFSNISFDEALSFSNTAFSLDPNTGTLILPTTDALVVTEYASTIQGALNITTNQHILTITENKVSLLTDGAITTVLDPLVTTEYTVGLAIGSEVIPSTTGLVLTEYSAPIARSIVGVAPALVITEYPVGLALDIVTQVGITNLSVVAPQVASIDYTPGSGGFIQVGTSLNILVITEQSATIGYSPKISATRDILAVQPFSSRVEYGPVIRTVVQDLILTNHNCTIGFDWQAVMGFDQLFLYERGLSKQGNLFEVGQPIPNKIPKDIPVEFR